VFRARKGPAESRLLLWKPLAAEPFAEGICVRWLYKARLFGFRH
jgi:hypothetical protein